MFYALLKFYARFVIRIYCKKIVINKAEILKQPGPMLLACNHPNSFLDGIILTSLFDHPVHSLARGDAFKIKWISRRLHRMKLLPVYRTSEGVENLEHNYTTFAACQETFKKKEIVLIFSEGKCVNEWHLRPLKKGTARLAIEAWKNNIPLTVVPTAINYSSFRKFGKEVHIYFGSPLPASQVLMEPSHGRQLLAFNEALNSQLKKFVYEIKPGDQATRKKIFSIGLHPSFFLFLLPGITGWILHAPLFFMATCIAGWRFRNNGHFDSVQTSILLLAYPFYWLALAVAFFNVSLIIALGLFVLLPFFAWAGVQLKYELDV